MIKPVEELMGQIDNERVRADADELLTLMRRATGNEPRVWNSEMIGFGSYHYRYSTGQEGDFFDVGFAPRKNHLTVYVMSGLRGFDDLLDRLGPHRATKSALHLKSLEHIDVSALEELIRECVLHLRRVEEDLGAIPRMSEIPPRDRTGGG